MTLATIFKQAEKFTADHSPQILTGIAVAGTLTTAVLTGKAAYKAFAILNEPEVDPSGYNAGFVKRVLEPKEKVLLTWKLFIPPAAVGVLTVASVITANQIGTRRAAAMAAAYTLSEKAFHEYKDKVVEKLGANKEQSVRDDIAQDRVRNNPVTERAIYATRGGSDLCFEPYSGRYFSSSMEALKKAQNDLNYQVINNYYASLSDFYDLLGLDRTKISDDLGWNCDRLLELSFSTVLSDDDRPCLVIDYHTAAIKDYHRVQ